MSDMSSDTLREITIERVSAARFRATTRSGATMDFGNGEGLLSPIDLFLTAIAGCGALDVEAMTRRQADPVSFTVTASGDKIRDENGNRLVNLNLSFDVTFPAGEGGDAARIRLPDAVAKSHDRLCTVSRTVEVGSPVATEIVTRG
jgi:uncharacterized OsmC-like protein